MMTWLSAWERQARLNPITPAILREHAELLAKSIGATVRIGPDYIARAALRTVWGPKIVDDQSYADRLHELGHLQTQDAKQHGVTVRLTGRNIANTAGETAAWQWARAHALIWTDSMEAEIQNCLATYRPYARHGVKDRIWRELKTVNGQLAVGHALWKLGMSTGMPLEAARQRLAQHLKRN